MKEFSFYFENYSYRKNASLERLNLCITPIIFNQSVNLIFSEIAFKKYLDESNPLFISLLSELREYVTIYATFKNHSDSNIETIDIEDVEKIMNSSHYSLILRN
tara:strand:- start:16366 stop:16677 length:312 start_codon:yes stop_codon:yes gene_type:complete